MRLEKILTQLPFFKELSVNLQTSKKRYLLTGIIGSAQSFFLASLLDEIKEPILIVKDDLYHAQKLADELTSFLSEKKVYQFPVEEFEDKEVITSSPELKQQRIQALNILAKRKPVLVVTSTSGIMKKLTDVELFKTRELEFKLGLELDLINLAEKLIKMGYTRQNIVMTPGEYSIRGAILDIYPIDQDLPIRIEFFDTEIDSMRIFDPNNQKSISNIEKATVPFITDDGTENKDSNIFNYLSPKGTIIVDDYPKIIESFKSISENYDNHKRYNEVLNIIRKSNRNQIFMSLFQKGLGNLSFSKIYDLKTRSVQNFFGQMPLLKNELEQYRAKEDTIVILAPNKERIKKISSIFEDFKIDVSITKENNILEKNVQIIEKELDSGFEFVDAKLVVLTEKELFSKVKRRKERRASLENAQRLSSYTDLNVGDYVVHVNHGIGRFVGIQTILVSSKKQDYMTIEYKNKAKLFIPVTQINRIQKYVSADSKTPKLNGLDGNEWNKTKQKVAGKIEDIADELILLYSKRKEDTGYQFSKDDDYQKEFEDAFPYSETTDQLRSVKEIKADMQKEKPMDRLLIGDVGFGKTEVALRAAFKAVLDGKQVAFLVPTTVLAQQHYKTIVDRFADFPVSVGILSRFNTKKQTEKTLSKLENGNLNIVVGTHRLLSKDVKFFDLGLLIVDEEQRFGVKHKEKIKQLKENVDVLTLTATPIPRTLNMSLLGVRDLSVIETPPLNRYPIQTYVIEQNIDLIAQGIKRELARNGQVFYLHNRIDDIEATVQTLSLAVPKARIAYIHGRMSENELERILLDFIDGDYDVLVTTTIIETGVDIPNANTLFVEDADRMGLSQLYQLRGRVGRTNRIAYAYFMYKPDKILTQVSESRLEAIKDFTELGSGFKIAMRDLAIRGAGNLLGKQQHGFIDSVGYDLYMQMLNDAISKRQGKKVVEKTDSEIILNIEAYIPKTYIFDNRQKIEIYRRIRQISDKNNYVDIQNDLIDRFGDYPKEVANLLEIGLLKMYADNAMIESIVQKREIVTIKISKKRSQNLSSKQLLLALPVDDMKYKINKEQDLWEIQLIVPKKTSEDTILKELQIIAKNLGESNETKKN